MCHVGYTIYRNVCNEGRSFPQALWVAFHYFVPLVVREASPGLFGGELIRYQNLVVLVLVFLIQEGFEVPVTLYSYCYTMPCMIEHTV